MHSCHVFTRTRSLKKTPPNTLSPPPPPAKNLSPPCPHARRAPETSHSHHLPACAEHRFFYTPSRLAPHPRRQLAPTHPPPSNPQSTPQPLRNCRWRAHQLDTSVTNVSLNIAICWGVTPCSARKKSLIVPRVHPVPAARTHPHGIVRKPASSSPRRPSAPSISSPAAPKSPAGPGIPPPPDKPLDRPHHHRRHRLHDVTANQSRPDVQPTHRHRQGRGFFLRPHRPLHRHPHRHRRRHRPCHQPARHAQVRHHHLRPHRRRRYLLTAPSSPA